MKLRTCVFCWLILLLLGILAFMGFILYGRAIYMGWFTSGKKEPENVNDTILLHKFRQSAEVVNTIQKTKNIIKKLNERQYIYNYKNNTCLKLDTTVLVIRVHPNISYLSIFLESIRRVWAINESLLIFAHDHFDDQMNSAIRRLKFVKLLQVFYPYSLQFYPNRYPGEDSSFCHNLHHCFESRKRDPILVQRKLFWWWVANEVFDHIKVLRNYTGAIYFIESENYLTSDFVHMAKMLEQLQPMFCSDCQILSLGDRKPQPEMYYPENSHMIISIWGLSNFSNSGIGFNRTTWNVIKSLRKHFCTFKDASWEKSLRYLALKTHRKRLFMISAEGPRFFPLTNCGLFRNDTDCDLTSNYYHIMGFLPKIYHGRFSYVFQLKFDGFTINSTMVMPESTGEWGDARDINLCMFFARKKTNEMF